jgi:hypothetical protein
MRVDVSRFVTESDREHLQFKALDRVDVYSPLMTKEPTGFSQSGTESGRSKNHHLPVQTSTLSELIGTRNSKSLIIHAGRPTKRITGPGRSRYAQLHLSGTRDAAGLVQALAAVNNTTPLEFDGIDSPPSTEAQLRDALTRYIDELPQRLAEMKLVRY